LFLNSLCKAQFRAMRGSVLATLAVLAVVKADDLIDEFNDPDMGVAFTVIPENVWERHGEGNNHMDAAGFYPLNNISIFHGRHQQAVSIVTRVQDMNPYDGGYGTYGLVFHVTEDKQFWKYFQVAGHGKDVLVAGPGDGANHIPSTKDWRLNILDQGKTYDWFTQQKNQVLAKYNTVYRNHDYNEFDTNGLSFDGVAGVFVNEQHGQKPGPSKETMCNFFMEGVNPDQNTWTIYGYKWHSLYVKDTLNCQSSNATKMILV